MCRWPPSWRRCSSFCFFRCQPTVASATSPLRSPSFAFLANIFPRAEPEGERRRRGDVGKEVEEATGGVNLQSAGWIASKISDIDGGEGDNGRDVERALRIVKSGRRRRLRGGGRWLSFGGVICVGGGGVKNLCNLRGGRRAGLPTKTGARATTGGKSSERFGSLSRDVDDHRERLGRWLSLVG